MEETERKKERERERDSYNTYIPESFANLAHFGGAKREMKLRKRNGLTLPDHIPLIHVKLHQNFIIIGRIQRL